MKCVNYYQKRFIVEIDNEHIKASQNEKDELSEVKEKFIFKNK